MSNLRDIREKLKVTQKKLAADIGHSPSSVGHYEAGRRSPDISTCHLIVTALGKYGETLTIEDVFPNPSILEPAHESSRA
ncbi:helix-turn-helix transcriptional regulator [Serratia sp. T13T92]|uniref:helix-turn-helix transcriptional regulator n=1 Tax=Serratia sp. T13T92 TaxID=3397496 RepID=UPI0039DFE0AC